MKEQFEDKFMDIQAGLISLCLEVMENEVDKVYAYAFMDDTVTMFNAFFEKNGKVLTLNQFHVDLETAMQFLSIGTADLEKIITLCEEEGRQIPTEIKMCYDVKTGKYNADYRYGKICPEDVDESKVFMEWYEEVKENTEIH